MIFFSLIQTAKVFLGCVIKKKKKNSPQFAFLEMRSLLFTLKKKNYVYFYNCIVPMGFLPWEIRVAVPGESQLRQSRASQPTMHAGCLSVSIIHRTLTWATWSLTCLAIWFLPDLINGRHDHTTAVCVSLRWSGGPRVVRLPAEYDYSVHKE